MAILAFDMGGTAVKYGVWDNELKDTGNFKTPETWNELRSEFWEVFEDAKIQYDIEGIAISTPGVVDVETGVIHGISAIDYIHGFPIQREFEYFFELPVTLENDANCAALAEVWQGKAKDINDALFVVIGTGIGGAVIQDRKLIKGNNLFAGEFGIMMLDEIVSFSQGGTAVNMAKRYCKRCNLPEESVSGKEVFTKALAGDSIAIEEENKFYDFLSQGIYNLMFTTDPEVIILGGGVTMHEPLVPNLENRIDDRLEKTGLKDYKYRLEVCEFKNYANLIGAIYDFMIKNDKIN